MKTKRIIARLDVKNDALVKGIHLEGLRVLGIPEVFAENYYLEGIDELLYMDVVASLYNRNSLAEFVRKTAHKIFVPLAVGGGIRTEEDVRELLNSGADKVVINTAAVKNPKLISDLAHKFGSSTIVVAIEAIKDRPDGYGVYIDNGREFTGLDALEWAKKIVMLGAGEIMLTSVDREGTGKGVCYELVDMITAAVSVPVIVHGGIGKVEHLEEAMSKENINAVCMASIFHYEFVGRGNCDAFKVSGNTSFIRSGNAKKNLSPISVAECKLRLRQSGLIIR